MTRIRIQNLKPVAATKAKTLFGEILHQTSVERKKFVVNRQGKPVAVILSYNEYCEMMERLEPMSRRTNERPESFGDSPEIDQPVSPKKNPTKEVS